MFEIATAISALAGVIVGGLITYWIEWQKYCRQAWDEAQRRKIDDLRLFQSSIDEVVDAIGHDSGELYALQRSGENLSTWHPWRTYRAFREAEKRAVWVTDQDLKKQWGKIQLDARSAQALVTTLKSEALRTEGDDQLIAVMSLRAFELVKASSEKYTEFNAALEALYPSLLEPKQPWRPKGWARLRRGLQR